MAANAVGDVFTVEGESLTGGDAEPGPPALLPESFTNTTLMLIATEARLTRSELSRLVVRAHDALAVCMRPTWMETAPSRCLAGRWKPKWRFLPRQRLVPPRRLSKTRFVRPRAETWFGTMVVR